MGRRSFVLRGWQLREPKSECLSPTGHRPEERPCIAPYPVRVLCAYCAMATTQQREDELTAGHALLRYTALVAVNAPDPAALEDSTAEVVAAAASARLRLRVLYGRQSPALAATLPMARATR